MKRIIPLVLLSVGACGSQESRHREFAIPPDILMTTNDTALLVPQSCPVYAPGGGDVDTPEAPFPPHVSIICGVAAGGETYGLVTGDAPTARLAVLPGGQELGLYIGIEPGANFSPDQALAHIRAWAAPVNVQESPGCCAETEPNSSLALRMIASGPRGMMISLGHFDDKPTQVAYRLDDAALFSEPPVKLPPGAYSLGWFGRFYVNGEP